MYARLFLSFMHAGYYIIYFAWTAKQSRATNTKILVQSRLNDEDSVVTVNQRITPRPDLIIDGLS
jgi:hypothetical protein